MVLTGCITQSPKGMLTAGGINIKENAASKVGLPLYGANDKFGVLDQFIELPPYIITDRVVNLRNIEYNFQPYWGTKFKDMNCRVDSRAIVTKLKVLQYFNTSVDTEGFPGRNVMFRKRVFRVGGGIKLLLSPWHNPCMIMSKRNANVMFVRCKSLMVNSYVRNSYVIYELKVDKGKIFMDSGFYTSLRVVWYNKDEYKDAKCSYLPDVFKTLRVEGAKRLFVRWKIVQTRRGHSEDDVLMTSKFVLIEDLA